MSAKGGKKGAAANKSANEHVIPSEDKATDIDYSEWPLLLKNFDKLQIRTAHYTPNPAKGHSPMKRPIEDYVKFAFFSLLFTCLTHFSSDMVLSIWINLQTLLLTKLLHGFVKS